MTIGEPIKSLGCKYSQVDVTSLDSVKNFKNEIGDAPIDMLLNIAGVMVRPERDGLETTTVDAFNLSFNVNATGVLLLTQALLPNILAAKNAKIGIVSSRVGSMTDNTSGGMYAYRASKAATNSVGVSLACDLKEKGVLVLLLHPGINNTNLAGGLGFANSIEPSVTAERLFKVMDEKTLDDTGKFFQYEGNELPW